MKLHQHARKKCLALDKFDGNHEALMAWLKHNRIALYLGGHAIDHELPSKIIGAFFSMLRGLEFSCFADAFVLFMSVRNSKFSQIFT